MVRLSFCRTSDQKTGHTVEEYRTAVIDVPVLGDSTTIRQKTDNLEKVWSLKTSLFPMVMGALGALTSLKK